MALRARLTHWNRSTSRRGLGNLIPTDRHEDGGLFGRDVHAVWDNGPNADVADWEVLSGHVNQILKYRSRNALGHVDYSASGRVPPSADESGAFAIQPGVSGPADTIYAAGHQDGMLCSMRVRVRSTKAIPSLLARSSVGERFARISSGVDNQCVALRSSPNTATAWAITGTREATTLDDVTILFYCESPFECSAAGIDPL